MFSIGKLLWGCVVLSALTFVTSFNLADPGSKSSNATATATTPTNDLNATTVPSNSSLDSSNSTANSTGDGLDDRFNFNLNLAGARGVSRYGGVSQSNALSYGTNVGIRGPGGQYKNLYSNSGAKSNGYSYGPGAPLTYANTGTRARPGYGYGGNAAAGIHGGKGSSYAQSINQNFEIPLDNRGTVLLSNLKERDNSTSTEASSASSSSSPAASSSSSSPVDVSSSTIIPSSSTTSGNKGSDSLVFS